MGKIYVIENMITDTQQAHRVLALTLIYEAIEAYQNGDEGSLVWLKETGIHWFEMAGYDSGLLQEKIVDITNKGFT